MRTIYIAILFVLAFAYGCEKEISYKGNKLDNFMVLNALLENDSLIKCRITRSNTLFDKGDIVHIEDATVELYQDDRLIETLTHTTNGYYQSESAKAVVGQRYAFKVTHQQHPSISVESKLPPKIEASISSIKYNDSEGRYDLVVNIKDMPGNNYYRVRGFNMMDRQDYKGDFLRWDLYPSTLYSEDPVLNYNMVTNDENGFSDYPDNEYMIFNDDLFDAEIYGLKFSTYGSEGSPMKFVIQHISEDLYKYYNSVQTNSYYEEDPFSEPVPIHSNIKNGAGILGTVTSSATLIALPPME